MVGPLRTCLQVVQFALAEDAGELGDVTTLSTYAHLASLLLLRRMLLQAKVQHAYCTA